MNIFLVIVAAILIGCTVLGAKKGFVHTIFTMFSLFIIIIITGVLSPYVADYINDHIYMFGGNTIEVVMRF